ncbi:MAG: sulfotransferase [Planctomycetota bacterium]|nr:sulfotransferase [Planctomycetota bacterium]
MPKTPDNQLLEQARLSLEAHQWPKAERVLKKLIKAHPGTALFHQQLGIALQKQGKVHRAIDSFKRAVTADPDDANLLMLLAHALQEVGRIDEARAAAASSLDLAPGDAQLRRRRGNLLMRIGQPHEAHMDFVKAHELAPEDIGILSGLVDGIIARGEVPMDDAPARELVDRQPYEARNHASLGTILRMNDELDAAAASYDAGLALDRFNPDARAGKAEILISLNQPGEAAELLRPLVNAPTCRYLPMLAWMRACNKLGEHEAAILAAERWLAADARSHSQVATMSHRLANAYDKANRRDKAFEAWRSGNSLHSAQWNAEEHTRTTEDVKRAFSSNAMIRLSRSTYTTKLPVFIVGMFRSGTSLTEQILACHSQVHGAGELPTIFELARELPGELEGQEAFPQCIEQATPELLDDMAARYLRVLEADSGDVQRITDKLPLNYLNIGFISLLFPETRIIHCRRDPLDTCFSCWGNSFSSRMAFTANFKTLGRAYRDYVELMEHWKDLDCLPILDVDYEELVQEPEPVTRRMIEYIGLDWDPACLKHHESSRVARTLSMDQVNSPISTSSIGRSRRYWEQLEPLRDALGDLAPSDPGT